MAIEHDSYTFGGITTHGLPLFDPWRLQDQIFEFFGVKGASEVRDEVKWRIIRLTADFTGFSTWAALSAQLEDLDAQINELEGVLSINSVLYGNCTFKGFERFDQAFYDGSGVNGWIQRGALTWLQIGPDF